MDKIIINGKEFDSLAHAYNTGMFYYEDLEGVATFDDEAEEFVIDFPDGSWVWHFDF